jgi:hypothetical protein
VFQSVLQLVYPVTQFEAFNLHKVKSFFKPVIVLLAAVKLALQFNNSVSHKAREDI